jgi:AcrR family transcriptional regulator
MNELHSLYRRLEISRKIDPAKRQAILMSARELLNNKGVEKTTISEIAAKAGVATGTIYLYFKSKSDIIDALCDYYLLEIIRVTSPALENRDIRQAITYSIRASFKHAATNADLVRLLDFKRSQGVKSGWPQADIAVQNAMKNWYASHVEEGSVHLYPPRILAELVGGMTEWVTKICFVWSKVDIERYENTVIELLCNALIIEGKEKVQG